MAPTPASPATHTPVNGGSSFNLQGTFANSSAPSYGSSPSPAPTSSSIPSNAGTPSFNGSAAPKGPTRADQEHAHLASLFANRDDGQDTFGNVGQLRYGQTAAGRLAVQMTGAGANNPFTQQQQQQQGQSADQPFFSI